MSFGWHARRRWALVLLLVGLPVYIVVATSILARFERPGVVVELLVYAGLGVLWALPFRFVFKGVGRPDPGASERPSCRPERVRPHADKGSCQ